MKWITREKVKVDRVACPWLIRKFVDPKAEFVFLPHDTDWASIKDGIVYDAKKLLADVEKMVEVAKKKSNAAGN